MKYLSLFSGIEAASLGFKDLGFEALGFSEIDNTANKLLKHHYPDIPNFGNILDYETWPDIKADLIVGGSPCQSFSYIGNRKGVEDERGKLTFTYTKVIEKYRPRWIIWENVQGVLTADRGKTFGEFISTLVKLGYGLSWRTLDTQFTRTPNFPFAIPQRRRRLFLVGYFGDWNNSSRVLFDEESFTGISEPTRGKYKDSKRDKGNSEGDCTFINFDINTGKNRYLTIRENHSDTITTKSSGYVVCKISEKGNNFIRYLTPLEMERLQGFPDGYTDVCGIKKTNRYKLLGNSMSVNCMEWIGIRLKEVNDEIQN